MLNTPTAPWCRHGTVDVDRATRAGSRVPTIPYARWHIPREALSSSVLFHVFILGLLMRGFMLSGPSDLSAVAHLLSQFDPKEKGCRSLALSLKYISVCVCVYVYYKSLIYTLSEWSQSIDEWELACNSGLSTLGRCSLLWWLQQRSGASLAFFLLWCISVQQWMNAICSSASFPCHTCRSRLHTNAVQATVRCFNLKGTWWGSNCSDNDNAHQKLSVLDEIPIHDSQSVPVQEVVCMLVMLDV